MNKKQLLKMAAALFLGAIASTTLVGQQANAAPVATKAVAYQGRTFQVPASWPVIDLAAAPTTCVRFDVSAVYLGSPPPDQNCPAGLLGRADSLLLEPAPQSTSAAVTQANDAAQQLTATASGIRATATYHSDRAAAQSILTSAGLPIAMRLATDPATTMSANASAAAAVSGDATNFRGKGFDPCTAPSASTMSAWKSASPYGAIGVYIGGVNRSCSQPNLTASWVSTQAAAGWKFFPLYVGLQAPSTTCSGCAIITSPASQGTAAADDAANRAAALGMSGVVIYFDMESYSTMNNTTALTFESAWTQQLHARGYRSGIYSSASSGILDLANHAGSYTMPDVVDFADWNGVQDTSDSHFSSAMWTNHQRIHQYSGGHNETYGGTTINIDSDYLDVSFSGVEDDGGRSVSAVYNPVGQAMEVYYSSGGSLTEHYWNPTGWHGPVGLGGPISGSPSAVANPMNNALEVYFNSGGTLAEKYWTTAGSWSTQVTLASGVIGSPTAVYNPAGNAIEIYYNLGGNLTEHYWNSTGWHGPINLGVAITGSPVAVVNPMNNALEVYFNSNGTLAEKYWTTAGSWSNTVALSGGMTGSPTAVYNPAANAIEIYYNNGGNLTEHYWNSTGWHGPINLGGPITGNPIAVANPMNNALEVYFNSNGTLAEKYWTTAGSWSTQVTLASGVTGSPNAAYNPTGNAIEVYYSSGGALTEHYWNSTGWHGPVGLGTPIS